MLLSLLLYLTIVWLQPKIFQLKIFTRKYYRLYYRERIDKTQIVLLKQKKINVRGGLVT